MKIVRTGLLGFVLVAFMMPSARVAAQVRNFSGNTEARAAGEDGSPTNGNGRSQKPKQINIVKAFTKALGALRGKVDLLNTNGVMLMRSTKGGEWLVQLERYPDAPAGGLSVKITEQGSVAIELTMGGARPEAWLAEAKGGKTDTKGKLRPEVAFRKAVELIGSNRKTLDWADVQGQIKLWRTSSGEWFFAMMGYPNLHLGGCWVIVQDDGGSKVASAL